MVVTDVNVRENWVKGVWELPVIFLQLFCKSQIISEVFFLENLIGRAYYFLLLFTDVTLPRLKAFIPQLLSRLHIEALLHGNITKQVRD